MTIEILNEQDAIELRDYLFNNFADLPPNVKRAARQFDLFCFKHWENKPCPPPLTAPSCYMPEETAERDVEFLKNK